MMRKKSVKIKTKKCTDSVYDQKTKAEHPFGGTADTGPVSITERVSKSIRTISIS